MNELRLVADTRNLELLQCLAEKIIYSKTVTAIFFLVNSQAKRVAWATLTLVSIYLQP